MRLSARGSPTGRRDLYPHKNQSTRGAGLAAWGQCFRLAVQPCESEHRGRNPQWDLACDLLEPEHMDSETGSRQGGKGPRLASPSHGQDFAHQSQVQSTWVLSSEGRDTLWIRGLGSKREKAPIEGPWP